MAPDAAEQLPIHRRLIPTRPALGLKTILAPITICFSLIFIILAHDTVGVRLALFASLFFVVFVAYPIPYLIWMISRFRREESDPQEVRIVRTYLLVLLIEWSLLLFSIVTFWVIQTELFAD